MTRKILVIDGGARGHALICALKNTGGSDIELYCAPGNAGIAEIAKCFPVKAEDVAGLLKLAKEIQPDLTVVGPEVPLVRGIADIFRINGFAIVGPSRKAARLEGSKRFAKEFMWRHRIPTAPARFFDDSDEAAKFVAAQKKPPVVKADGLCGGKGVTVAKNAHEAFIAVNELMVKKRFGDEGKSVVIEEKLDGKECSFIVLTDGVSVVPFKPATDYKRRFNNNNGPNTGGMGCYSPVPMLTEEFEEMVMEEIVSPTVYGLAEEKIPYLGFLYFGLMLTERGPQVLEYNVRMGDPEGAVILPLLHSDFSELLFAAANREINGAEAEWHKGATVGVVIAHEGYPEHSSSGKIITGIKKVEEAGALVFHAGTTRNGAGELLTAGGRILTIVSKSRNIREARYAVYDAAMHIRFSGMDYRRDIALTVPD